MKTSWKTIVDKEIERKHGNNYIANRIYRSGLADGLSVQQILDAIADYRISTKRQRSDAKQSRTDDTSLNHGSDDTSKSIGSITHYEDGTEVHNKLIEIEEGTDITPELMLELHGLCTDRWTVKSYTNNYWNAQVKGGKRIVMYQSKLTVAPKDDTTLTLDDIRDVCETVYRTAPARIFEETQPLYVKGDYSVEVNFADFHLGKITYDSINDTIRNVEEQVNEFDKLLEDTICRILSCGRDVKEIVFVWSNDFYNIDTPSKTTTKGTPQDTSIPAKALLKYGSELLAMAITKLSELAHVVTFYTPSNHDEMMSYSTALILDAYFHDWKNVDVSTTFEPRFYYTFGKNLIGFCHGSNEKVDDLMSIMSRECADVWGQCTHKEFHTAHLHKEIVATDLCGGVVRRVSSPTDVDTWLKKMGCLNDNRCIQLFFYEHEKGLEAVEYVRVQDGKEW